MTEQQYNDLQHQRRAARAREQQRADDEVVAVATIGGWCCLLGVGVLECFAAFGQLGGGGSPPVIKKTLYVKHKNEFITLKSYHKMQAVAAAKKKTTPKKAK